MMRLAQITRGLALYATDEGSRTRLVLSMRQRPVELVEELTAHDVRALQDVLAEWMAGQPDPDRVLPVTLRPSPGALP